MSNIEQRANGSYINQAARDINIHAPTPVVTDGLIPCPQCQHHVSPYADSCLACGFPVFGYFEAIRQREAEKRNTTFRTIVGLTLITGASGFLYLNFPEFPYKHYVLFGGIGAVVAAELYSHMLQRISGRK